MSNKFDEFVAIDWSGAQGRYPGISIARCRAGDEAPALVRPETTHWTRSAVADWLSREARSGKRQLIGFDFAFGLPFDRETGYFGGCAPEIGDIFSLWNWIELRCRDDDDFGCAEFFREPAYNALFWRAGPRPAGWIERHRRTDAACAVATGTRPESIFKLLGPKQVGKASLSGIHVLHHVRTTTAGGVAIWPFEATQSSVMVEIYPTLFRYGATRSLAKIRSRSGLNAALRTFDADPVRPGRRPLTDHDTDALLSAAALRALASRASLWDRSTLIRAGAGREGWIFGVGAQ